MRNILLLRTGFSEDNDLFEITKENCENSINSVIICIIFIDVELDEKLFREYASIILDKIEENIGYPDIYTAVYSAYSENEFENIENCISENIVYNRLFVSKN